MKKPTIKLNNNEYHTHLMEMVMMYGLDMYMRWFKEEGSEMFNKWKEKKYEENTKAKDKRGVREDSDKE